MFARIHARIFCHLSDILLFRFDKAASYVIRRVGRHVRELALRRFLVNEYGMGNGLENALLDCVGENLRSLSIEYRLLEWPWLAKFVAQTGGKLRTLSLSCVCTFS